MRNGFYRLILHQCAFSFIRRESWDLVELFNLYQDFGQFPFPGTILEQPAVMIDAFRIFQAELAAIRVSQGPLTKADLMDVVALVYGTKK